MGKVCLSRKLAIGERIRFIRRACKTQRHKYNLRARRNSLKLQIQTLNSLLAKSKSRQNTKNPRNLRLNGKKNADTKYLSVYLFFFVVHNFSYNIFLVGFLHRWNSITDNFLCTYTYINYFA